MLFTDYLGDLPYNDGVLDQSTYAHSDATRYLGLAAEKDISSGAETYYHGDLIDSTMLATDADADAGVRMAYTAFGEVLTTGDPNEAGRPGGSPPEGAPRYLYAGGWGYESGGFTSDASPEQTWALSLQGADTSLPPITLQHLGHRWYQPDLGRFVQRDPIGIHDEWNVYTYVDNGPDSSIDVDGQTRVFVQAKRGIPHAAVIMQSGNKFVSIKWSPDADHDSESMRLADVRRCACPVYGRCYPDERLYGFNASNFEHYREY